MDISANFEFGGHSPPGAHSLKRWRFATMLGKWAQAV